MLTFIKFFVVGVGNTALDLLVLNTLVFFFGTGAQGELYIVFKSVSFFAAVLNSYVLNKFWVFSTRSKGGKKEPVLFFVVSGIGYLLNVGVSFAAFHTLNASGAVATHSSVTVAAMVGSAAVLVWNFIGYKLLVFKKTAHA